MIKQDRIVVPLKKRLLSRIGEIWTADMWVRGERQHYHALRALQILKQQIFHDKLRLFKEAKYANLLNLNKYKTGLSKPEFLILRRGIHFRIERYITSLRTQQQNFGKSLDFGLQRYPRPSVDRRREIGIFNDFLSNRTIDLQADTLHLLAKITDTEEKTLYKESSMILHGWSPLMNVRNKQLWDNVRRDAEELNENTSLEKQDISYLDTSFWSPDRPDLQPLVSKEIAYSALRSLSNGFSDNYFANKVNELTKLWVLLSKEITTGTDNVVGLEVIHKNSECLIRDMVSDCIAVSLKGISYLYALYLSSIGLGLENLLRLNKNNEIKLESVEELSRGISAYNDYYAWYFRLKFTAFWLQRISKNQALPMSKLDQVVFDGIEGVCEDLIIFLDKHNISGVRCPVGKKWKKIYNDLEASVQKTNILNIIIAWKKSRRKDTWDEVKQRSGKKEYHRSTIRLNARLQHFMFIETIKHKLKPYKALSRLAVSDTAMSDKFLSRSLCAAYGIQLDSINIPYTKEYCNHSKQLFRQLHDIPFQCSVMHSIDLLGRLDKEQHNRPNWKQFVHQVHNDMSLGRDFFSFALEFYTWNRESPKSRLLLSINMLAFSLPFLKSVQIEVLQKFYENINHWLTPDKKDELDDICKLSHKKIRNKYIKKDTGSLNIDNVKRIGAIQLDDAFCKDNVIAKSKRRLEQISGYKLKELLTILNIHIKPIIEDSNKRKDIFTQCRNKNEKNIVDNVLLISNLIEFLKIRDDEICRSNKDNEFFHLILNSCGTNNQSQLKKVSDDSESIIPIIITRLALSSSYTTANPKVISHQGSNADFNNNFNILSLADVLKKDRWLQPVSYYFDKKGQKRINYNNYSIVLGRYDVVSFIHTNLPCLCRVSYFPKDNGKIQIEDMTSIENHNEKEAFITHFPRREIAFSLKLYGDCDFNDAAYKLYAISSISLQRRSMRLNLLYRLLNARYLKDKQHFLESSVEYNLNKLIASFEKKNSLRQEGLVIKVLLTDGWGDLLLVFMCKNDEMQVGNLYDDLILLQQALYEDFMVDRTELIYTPQCLDHMDFRGKYRFNFLFRFQEDRQLERSILNFIKALQEKKKYLPKWINKKNSGGDLDIVFTPGQYDIRIHFHIDTQYRHIDNIYNTLIEWLAKPEINEAEAGETYHLYNQWYNDGLSFIDKLEAVIEKIQ